MSKHDEHREHTKKSLKEAFWVLYKEKPINEIRVQDVTDQAGYHRATFYLYYTDIYALLAEETDELISYLADHSQMFKDLPVNESILILQDYFDTYGDKLALLLGPRYNDDLMTRFKEIMYPRFRKNLDMNDSLKSEIICEYTIQGMQMAFRCWYSHRDEMKIEESDYPFESA